MKNLLVVLFFLISVVGKTQWNTMPVTSTNDLFSVDYFSANEIWIGSFNRIIKTSNGGSSWTTISPLRDLSNANIQPANMNDLVMINSTSAIATGLYYTGNSEVILKTVNSGSNWNQVSLNNSVPLLRYINSIDRWMSSGLMVAVGNNGRIMRSTDFGSNWNLISSGINTLINDVKFASTDTVYACATNNILRSFDGGLAWSVLSVAGDFANIDCKNEVVYVTKFSDNSIVKSIDNGQSFTTINLPFIAEGAIKVISKDTVLLSGSDGLYVTYNGGTVWEKYVLSLYKKIYMFDFRSPQNGVAVGRNAFALRTFNLSAAPSLPLTDFQIPALQSTYCSGDSITLLNETVSMPGYTFQWLYDGVPFSSSYNSGLHVTGTVSAYHDVSLVTTNTYGTDTATMQVWVYAPPIIQSFSLLPTSDTVCSGNFVSLIIPISQTGVSYQLRTNNTNIGIAQNGNGGELVFGQGSGLTSNINYNIKALMTNACFIDSVVMYQSIYVHPVDPNEPIAICTPPTNACGSGATGQGITNFTFAGINNTSTHRANKYFNYAGCINTDVIMGNVYPFSITSNFGTGEYVKGWIDFNNDGTFHVTNELVFSGFANSVFTGNITINTTTVFNQPVRMRIASSDNSLFNTITNVCSTSYCGEIEDYSITILPSVTPPVSNFTFVTVPSGCLTNVNFTNTSYNATDYIWDFGDGSPQVNTQNTSHGYTVTGNYLVTLITNNPYGTDTIVQMVNIVNPQVPIATTCNPTVTTTCSGRPYINMIQFDGNVEMLSGGNRNYTCVIQYELMADTSYVFFVGAINSHYFLPYLDANNNGFFEEEEELMPSTSTGIQGDPLYFNIPYSVIDSVPLRMRLFMSKTFFDFNSVCGSFCGDYKDFTVFIHHRPFETNYSADFTEVCTLDSATINFQDNSVGAVSWLWDFGDGNTSILQSPAHTYTNFGDYTVKLKIGDSYGHYDSLIMTNYISINEILPNPIINVNAGILSSSILAPSYIWYMDGNVISGANNNFYQPLTNGFYSVDVISSGGCISKSDTFQVELPEANFYADTLIYCDSDSAMVDFYNTSLNATDYFWDFGDGQTSILISPSHSYDSTGFYEVKLVACNLFACDTLLFSNYIIINPSTDVAISPVSIPIICGDTSIVLDAEFYSFLSYQWQKDGIDIPFANDTSFVIQTSGNYQVIYQDTLGCSGISNSVELIIDTTCVWPGDTDFDFMVSQYDLLPIGLFYGITGPSRSAIDISWIGHATSDWNTQQASGFDIKHIDCNGDGVIDDVDTLAVNLNFSEIHNFSPNTNEQRSTDPDLFCSSSSAIYEVGEWVEIDINAGNSVEPIFDLYGIGFALEYDNSLIEPGTSSLIFSDSWLTDNATDGLSIGKILITPSESKIGLTRISHTGKNGYGKLATFRFQVAQNILASTMMDFSVTEYLAVDPNETNLNFDYNLTHSIELIPSTASISENSSALRNFNINPNPFNEQMSITFELIESANIVLEVYNSIGQIIKTLENGVKNPGAYNYLLSDEKNQLDAGVYFIKFVIDGRSSMQKVIKTN